MNEPLIVAEPEGFWVKPNHLPLALTGPSKIFVSPVVFHILMPAIELPFTVRVPVVKSRLPPTALISPEVGPDDAAQVMELVMVTRLELRFSIFC